ncbi:hypothetical protein EN781_11265 [Mesorhizobium sp. M4A.F.Ca.ET.090.04.2.1]|uniref:hypothetical protein n=1 Tax=Mesorhizobium sp. M4A.F.Ca.ET.090.04.2.1 TaxID=2496663 RepID=UPI000FCAD6F0|nr:hypothetical protein [Mesorhizobium sp. M4A.F.Ca.ET.090.04.2.1]RVC45108.1 hypothetical protein EN781_11265 [Mesorhizobium sp. M4A.F.Ca.ET.090.04.2.1]
MGGLPRRPGRGSWGGWETPTAPTVPEVPEIQTTLPTSAYGQTIPVVYGKCRLPAAYIWCAPILTVTSTHIEFWDTVTTTTSKLTARLRFARPLVPDSTWTMRKLYANGKLVYDGSVGYRQKGLKFTAYDGRGDQPRDPAMVREEGADFVSAHRGYLDVVVVDFDIVGYGAPPVFEAEWIQDGSTTHDYDTFTTLASGFVSRMDPDWDNGILYGFTQSPRALRRFSIGATAEYFSVSNPIIANYFVGFRYVRSLDREVYLAAFTGVGDAHGVLLDPLSGSILAESGSAATSGIALGTCLSETNTGAVLVGFADNEQIFAFYVTASTIERSYQSIASFGGYSSIQCVTPGEVRGSELDFWFCADADLVKVTLTSLGTFKSSTVVATFTDDLRYAVYDDGDLVVWTDAATVKRVNGTTGAVEFSASVPYQVGAVGSRPIGDPDQHRLVNEFYYTVGGVSYFTNLSNGATRSVSGAVASPNISFYDGEQDLVLTVNNAGVPQRMRITSDDGTQRQLEDFLVALMEAGGFSSDEIEVINVDDVIDGAVIDVTNGVRDIAKSICEPYSIAIFERAGKIIFKRAFTDGAFAIDATLAPTGDVADMAA